MQFFQNKIKIYLVLLLISWAVMGCATVSTTKIPVKALPVRAVAFSPDGRLVLSGGGDWEKNKGVLKLWEITSGHEIHSFSGNYDVKSVAFSPDGRLALSGESFLKLWKIASGHEIRKFRGHSYNVHTVAFSPDGQLALSGGGDIWRDIGEMKLWEVSSGREIRSFHGHSDFVSAVAFSPDGRLALSGSMDKTLKLWEVSSGREIRSFRGHSSTVYAVAFSPDGRLALSGSYDSTMKLWEVSSGREIRSFRGHSSTVEDVAFSPDGRLALSGSYDRTMKLWEVSSGREIRSFRGHSSPVFAVAFSPDGRRVLSGSDDGTTRLWDVQTGEETTLMISFTDGEWITITSQGDYVASTNAIKYNTEYKIEAKIQAKKARQQAIKAKQQAKMRAIAPSNLKLSLAFNDDDLIPNNTIDAGEKSLINVKITNEGEGTAFDVKLKTKTGYNDIDITGIMAIGDIPPSKTKQVTVNLKAGLDLSDGKATFVVTCQEKRGYDCKKYNLNVAAAALKKPALRIVNYKINDGNSGFAKGNGNGIPENGETIELIPSIKNEGVGSAFKVNLSISAINSGIKLKKDTVIIPQILPKQTVTDKLVFTIPTTFTGGKIKVNLAASDIRGASTAKQLFAINTETRQPRLAYTYDIKDNNSNGLLENGEQGELVIYLTNEGQMEARNINIELQANGINFSKNNMTIRRLKAKAHANSLSFPFTVPRTLGKSAVNVNLRLTQQNFSGLTAQIDFPIKLVQPRLQIITHQLIDSNQNGIIELGEKIALVVKVKNIGQLAARNVVLNLKVSKNGKLQKGVLLDSLSPRQIKLGRLPAGAESEPQKFVFNVQRRADKGKLPIRFSVNQQDFEIQPLIVSLNIADEQAEVINVAGNQISNLPIVASQKDRTPPQIVLHTKARGPTSELISDTNSYPLTGQAIDKSGIAFVTVNGKRASLDKQGYFSAEIQLHSGDNSIYVTAADKHNNVANKTIVLTHQGTSSPPTRFAGNYHALIIGINNYQHLSRLATAVNDARTVAEILKKQYGFSVSLLLDRQATRRGILKAFNRLSKKLGKNDHLLIYYAGHGYYDKDGEAAYWLPSDAQKNEDIDWISASSITTHIKRNQARNILIVADSCYSGTLTKRRDANVDLHKTERQRQRYLKKMMNKQSRVLIASGGNEPVSDSGGQGHSIFAQVFLDGLRRIERTAFTAEELFSRHIQERVAGNVSQTPEYQVIRESGHNSGDFVFQRR